MRNGSTQVQVPENKNTKLNNNKNITKLLYVWICINIQIYISNLKNINKHV